PTCQREITGDINVARIKLNGATQLGNRLVPMPKPPLDQGSPSDDVKVVWKTLLGLLKFRQRPGEIVLPVIAVITKRKVSLRQVRIVSSPVAFRHARFAGTAGPGGGISAAHGADAGAA